MTCSLKTLITTSDQFGINTRESDIPKLPQTEEELQLHMQITYKQALK